VTWTRITKGDPRGREMADRHYTRQRPGSPSWTRPGYNYVLYVEFDEGRALWCWWRPKWEDGRPGTERKDGLRCLECTMFRREGRTPLASELCRSAVEALATPEARADLHLDAAGPISDGLITGIGSEATAARRGKRSRPGECYRRAGWIEIEKRTGRADVWLWHPWPDPTTIPLAAGDWREK